MLQNITHYLTEVAAAVAVNRGECGMCNLVLMISHVVSVTTKMKEWNVKSLWKGKSFSLSSIAITALYFKL